MVTERLEASGTRACPPLMAPDASPYWPLRSWVGLQRASETPASPCPPGPGGSPCVRAAGGKPWATPPPSPPGLVGWLGSVRVPSCGEEEAASQQSPGIWERLWAALATAALRGGRAGRKGDSLPSAPGQVGGGRGGGLWARHSPRLRGASLSTKPRARDGFCSERGKLLRNEPV